MLDTIFHRISVRKYEDRPVEAEKTEMMLKAAMAAPSACNQQPWEFYVVAAKETICALSYASPYGKFIKDAPMAIVAVYREDCKVPEYAQIDLAIAVENMWLAADDLGLGGVWIGIAPETERMLKVEEILNIPRPLRAFAIFAYGYPAESRPQQNRFQKDRIHYIP